MITKQTKQAITENTQAIADNTAQLEQLKTLLESRLDGLSDEIKKVYEQICESTSKKKSYKDDLTTK